MQMKVDPPGEPSASSQSRLDAIRTDRSSSSDDAEVPATIASTDEEPIVLGPEKARGASTNRMPARVLLISITLTAVVFVLGYLLVR